MYATTGNMIRLACIFCCTCERVFWNSNLRHIETNCLYFSPENDGREMETRVFGEKMLPGKAKVKKKMRVEDIITNLTKKVKQVIGSPPQGNEIKQIECPVPNENVGIKGGSVVAKEDEITKSGSAKADGNALNKFGSPSSNGNVATTMANESEVKEGGSTLCTNIMIQPQVSSSAVKTNGSTTVYENTDSISGLGKEEDLSSYVSMCTIRNDPPEYTDLNEMPTLTKAGVTQDKNTGNLIQTPPKIIQTTSANPARQVFLQTIPQRTSQQTPIILNKLPPGFIIRSDLPASSFTNLQATTASGQPKLLLITKSGGPFYLAQNVNTSANQTQAKPINKPIASPVSTQTKQVIASGNSSVLQQGRPVKPSSNTLKVSSPSQLKTGEQQVTVQYNLPYPNNHCKIVSTPVNVRSTRAVQPGSFQSAGNRPGTTNVLVSAVPRPNGPREMVVNFAGNQTAHITTMAADEPSVTPKSQPQSIASLVYGSPTSNASAKAAKLSPEKRSDKTIYIVTTPGKTLSNTKQKFGTKSKNVGVHIPQRKSIYDEKIAKLNGKMTNINQAAAVNGKAKTFANGFQRKSNSAVNNVRVSHRKRQQTERAKLFENETKKRKKHEEKSAGKVACEQSKIKEKEAKSILHDELGTAQGSHNITLPKPLSLTIQQSPKSPSKKNKPSPQQSPAETAAAPVKEADAGSLFRDPALLSREERALQRALMRFKELEQQQARKESVSGSEKTCKSGKTNQVRTLFYTLGNLWLGKTFLCL